MFTGRRAHRTGDVASGNPVTCDSASRKVCGKGCQRTSQSDGAMLRCGVVFVLASTHVTKCGQDSGICATSLHITHTLAWRLMTMTLTATASSADSAHPQGSPRPSFRDIPHPPSGASRTWHKGAACTTGADGACHKQQVSTTITNQLESGSVQSSSKHVLTATLHPVRLARIAQCSRTNRPASKSAAI